jgi:hypothetical protein
MIDDPPPDPAEDMRARCKALVESYIKPGRFKVSDTWRDDMSPSEVYETGIIDASSWIKEQIATLKSKGEGKEEEMRGREWWDKSISGIERLENKTNDPRHWTETAYWEGRQAREDVDALIADWRKRGEALMRAREYVDEIGIKGKWREGILYTIDTALKSKSLKQMGDSEPSSPDIEAAIRAKTIDECETIARDKAVTMALAMIEQRNHLRIIAETANSIADAITALK